MELYQNALQKTIDKCKNGDSKAQYELYRQYSKAMYNVSLRICGNTAEAEDILQEAFLQAFAKINTYRQESAFGAWLKKIVVNTAINETKKKKDFVISLETNEIDVAETVDEDTLTLQVANVKKAIEKLPDGFRVIFSLYSLEGYDHQEIADILGISLSTSKTQYMRAKQKLIEILKKS